LKFSVNVEYKNKFCEYSLPSVSNVEMHLGLSEIDCPYSIKLSAFDGQWKIKRNKNSTIYYNNPAQRSAQRVDEKVLMPSDIFKVFFPDESFAVIMIVELTENNLSFKKYDIKDINRITVGKDDMSVISVKYKFISNEHIEIIKNGKSCNINVLKNSNPVFINGNFLNGTATLSPGDVINTVDFKIIFLGDILAVNMKNNIKTVLPEIDVSSYEYISRNKKLLPAFSRAPRDIEPLYCEPVLIEPAPNAQRTNEKPFIWLEKEGRYYVELANKELGNLVRIDNFLDNLPDYLNKLKIALTELETRQKDIQEVLKNRKFKAEVFLRLLLTKEGSRAKIIKEKSATVQQRFAIVYSSGKATFTLGNVTFFYVPHKKWPRISQFEAIFQCLV